MAGKLKSTIKGIHWSLAFKALTVFVLWAYFPEWLAWVFGALFYFSSFFRARHMGLPALSAFVLAHLLGQTAGVALLLGIIFFLILGKKELVFINRQLAATAMIFLLLFMAGFLLYENLDVWNAWTPVKTFFLAWFFWALTRGFLDQKEKPNPKYPLALGVMSFLLWEVATLLAFLPLDFLYQAAITIFMAFIFFEWLLAYAEMKLEKNKILLYVSFLFILATLIFSFAKWSL